MDIQKLLNSYPRKRSPLTERHEAIYEKEYKLNRGGKTFFSSLSQKTESWMHRQIAGRRKAGSILEIGAGTLNHLGYESPEKTTAYDIVEPFENLYKNNPQLSRLRRIHKDIAEIPQGEFFDRILSVAVLEHLTDLPSIVARSALHLREGGIFQHGIPSEGGLTWGLSWRLTTGLAFRLRTGLSYQTLMRHEHVNRAPEILEVVRYFFGKVSVKRFPFKGHHFSFYTYLEAAQPNRARCEAFLERRRS